MIWYSRSSGSYHYFLDSGVLIRRKGYWTNDSYWPLFVSQMTTHMFQLSCLMLSQSRPFPVHQLTPDFREKKITWWARLVEQELIRLPKQRSSPPVFMWGSCCPNFNFLGSILFIIVYLVILFSFGHCIVCPLIQLRLLIIPLASSNFSCKSGDFICSRFEEELNMKLSWSRISNCFE